MPVLRVATLGLIAGYVDAVGYVELHGIYSAAMTENSTTFGVSLARHDWGRVASVGTVLGLFFMGALGAAIVRRSLRQWRYEWLWIAALLLLAQFVHWSHAANASSRAETLFLTVAMAMQGKCCRAFPAHPYRPSSSRTTSLNSPTTSSRTVGTEGREVGIVSHLHAPRPWVGLLHRRGFPVRTGAGHDIGFFLFPIPLLIALCFLHTADLEEG
ncbi:YoaK family protein [Komagataeibacter rhaeticus]|nr:YoaK family protein [Komagataeibacter rhaeticus]